MCKVNQIGENTMETGKKIHKLSTSMIGIFEGLNDNGDYILNPVATLDDYNNNKLTGIKIGNHNYFKYLDQVFDFVIKKSYVTDSSGTTLDNLKPGDSITFKYEADAVEHKYNRGLIKQTYNELCNIKITEIRIYNLFDAVYRLVDLAYNDNKMARYRVFHKKPKDLNKLNAIQSELIRSNLSPQALVVYNMCLMQHVEEYIEKSDIKSYLPNWDSETIYKAISELVDLRYLLEDPIYDLIDSECLPSYITDSNVWKNEYMKTESETNKSKQYLSGWVYSDSKNALAVELVDKFALNNEV